MHVHPFRCCSSCKLSKWMHACMYLSAYLSVTERTRHENAETNLQLSDRIKASSSRLLFSFSHWFGRQASNWKQCHRTQIALRLESWKYILLGMQAWLSRRWLTGWWSFLVAPFPPFSFFTHACMFWCKLSFVFPCSWLLSCLLPGLSSPGREWHAPLRFSSSPFRKLKQRLQAKSLCRIPSFSFFLDRIGHFGVWMGPCVVVRRATN